MMPFGLPRRAEPDDGYLGRYQDTCVCGGEAGALLYAPTYDVMEGRKGRHPLTHLHLLDAVAKQRQVKACFGHQPPASNRLLNSLSINFQVTVTVRTQLTPPRSRGRPPASPRPPVLRLRDLGCVSSGCHTTPPDRPHAEGMPQRGDRASPLPRLAASTSLAPPPALLRRCLAGRGEASRSGTMGLLWAQLSQVVAGQPSEHPSRRTSAVHTGFLKCGRLTGRPIPPSSSGTAPCCCFPLISNCLLASLLTL
ncbi:hypothetical protein B0T11DRAFT_75064 [Plectosphaerella cucumerina]|uniref:Uncharacterized protein n=1 Tax=Plectosphaerella cucumerina TaxID=40658 RepID=A0A8K0TCU7_9PEZI|nr:hypothetical protein B0T11DRAFT_75064 [Plectosphaerella cucumerina]